MAERLLRPYVQGGSKFFVAKVDVKKVRFENGQAMLSPLRFHYDSDTFALPVRLGLANSAGTQDLIVHHCRALVEVGHLIVPASATACSLTAPRLYHTSMCERAHTNARERRRDHEKNTDQRAIRHCRNGGRALGGPPGERPRRGAARQDPGPDEDAAARNLAGQWANSAR
jgi:hypothetical protein